MIPPPCTFNNEALCRLHHLDEDEPGAEITPPQWHWQQAERIAARIDIDGSSPVDACRCMVQFVTLMVRDLLRRPLYGVDPDDLRSVQDCLYLALGPEAVERAVIEVQCRTRPKWLP